ncbi:hypothetical protein N7532_003876 [Penicillium argentinense]|uniref:Cytochrome P450 n=1 Tax=Penicillium argentinense TaxID=1131581 RepID=A0A9W9FNB7_9EURO|nr:uncharacterized protein N7532_003876 [Penicillium argentinense]KAJ5103347.1 hypothetical protein N7532_003876 [Penicillium argentinense]
MTPLQELFSRLMNPPTHTWSGLLALSTLFVAAIAGALIIVSTRLSNDDVPFPEGRGLFAILYQQYRFVVDGPGFIKIGYDRFIDGLFEVPRTFRFGQVIICKPSLIQELKNTRSAVASSEPWIEQLLQISHTMPGYFPAGKEWPAIAKTTPGVIRGTVHKHLDRYVPTMNEAILTQIRALKFTTHGECTVSCFEFAYSVVARSGSFAMVGERLAHNEEYIQAVKEHILGMIMTTRVQFLIPDCLKRYIGGFISRLATLGTRWDMNASRKILLKHFEARATEYRRDITRSGELVTSQANPEQAEKPVEIFRWLFESSVLRHRWSYSEVLGEMLLLQFAFVYTTGYALYGALAELARHPEYIQPLREEIETTLAKYGATISGCDQMILLDSFLKECQRLHPPAAGITLRPGTHIGVPSSWIQRSSVYYENPETFDGYRFLKLAAAGAKNTKLVDLSPDYLVFGMGVHAW